MELLHESRLEILKIEGKLYVIQPSPKVCSEPILRSDTEVDGAGALCYGTVLYDGGRYRMWYQAYPRNWDGRDVTTVAYAESDDGVNWIKPSLGLVDHGGTDNNLCDLGLHSPSVFIDPRAPDSHRYRATGYRAKQVHSSRGEILPDRDHRGLIEHAGCFTSHSADGLHWRLDSPEMRWKSGDVITSIYHPHQERAIIALKQNPRVGGFRRRSIWNAELKDGEWSGATRALLPDAFDDVAAVSRGYASGDYYGMGMMAAGTGTVGFLWQFRHNLPRSRGSETGIFGVQDVSLVYQAGRGDTWQHLWGRREFLSHDRIPWGDGGIFTSSGPVEVGDEQRLYFHSFEHTHAWFLDNEWRVLDHRRTQQAETGLSQIGYASWPRDRLFGFRSDPEASIELDLGEWRVPVEIHLNYKTRPSGLIRAAIEGDPARSLDASDVMSGDDLGGVLRWDGNAAVTPRDHGELVLKLQLESAEVYAYEVVEVS